MRLLVKLYFKYLKLTKKRTIKIPSWIKDIPSGTFNNLPELEEIIFNGEIYEIQKNAFSCCPSLKTIRFNKNVDNIDSQAFDDISEVTFCFSKKISSEDIKRIRQILRKEKSNPADEGFETENATESLVETTAADDLSDTLNKSDSAFITEEDETVSATTSFEDTIVSTADEVVSECVTEENDNSCVPDTMEAIEAATGDEVITDYEEEKEIVSVLDASEAPITDTVDEDECDSVIDEKDFIPAPVLSEDTVGDNVEPTESFLIPDTTNENNNDSKDITEDNAQMSVPDKSKENILNEIDETASEFLPDTTIDSDKLQEITVDSDIEAIENAVPREESSDFASGDLEEFIAGANIEASQVDVIDENKSLSVPDMPEDIVTHTVDEAAPELLKEDIELTPAQEVSEDVTIAGDIDNEIDSALDEKEYISDISPEVATDNVDEADDITISEENVTEPETVYEVEKADDNVAAESEDEFVEKQPVVDTFEEIVLEEKKEKEKPDKTAKRSRVLSNESKEYLRKRDRTKYSNCNSLTDIKTTDKLVEKLIERYSMLENKYSHDFPLGLIDVSKDEFNALALRVKNYIVDKNSITVLTGFISTMFLVKVVENYGVKGDFWRSVSALLKCNENDSTVFLKEALLSFCSSERLYFHYYDNIRSYTGTVQIHAVIGADELTNTLNFLRDFYIEEMYETYAQETVTDHISYFIKTMSNDIDDKRHEKTEISGLYHISFNIKNACREFSEAMADILKCLLFNINAYYHKLPDASYSPAVFYKYFKRWYINDIRRSRTTETQKKKTAKSRTTATTAKQVEKLTAANKCSYFIDENNYLFLYIPQYEVLNEYAYNHIITRLYENDKPIDGYDIENEVFGIFRFKTNEQVIKLNSFYRNLSIRIETEDGTLIFDSKSQLFRKYLIFSTDLTELQTRTVPDDRFYILTEKGSDFFVDDHYNSYPKYNYIIHSLDVEKNCDIIIDSQNIFRNNNAESDVSIMIDREYHIRNVRAVVNGIEYKVYTDILKVKLDYLKETSAEYVIDINDVHIAVDEINGNSLDLTSYTNSRYITVSLRKKGNLRKINEWSIAVIKGFEYTLDKEYYYSEKSADLFDLYADDIEFDIQDYPYSFPITRSRELTINASDNEKELTFIIKLPVIYWEINDIYNSISGMKYVSAANIREERFLTIEAPVNNIQLIAVNEKMSRQLTISNHKVNISDFHNSSSDSTTFGIYSKEIGQLELFELIYTPSLRDISVICNGEQMIVSFICIGICPVQVEIKDKTGNKVLSKSYSAFNEGNVTFIEDLTELTEGVYTVELYKLKADSFGFTSSKELEGAFSIVKGSPFEVYLSSHNNELKPEYCFFDGNDKKRVNSFYCENISKPDSESEVYSAEAFFYNRNGDKVYLKDANPLRIELLEKSERMLTFTMTDHDNDGLLYENARGYLVSDSSGIRDYNSYSLPDHYAIKL